MRKNINRNIAKNLISKYSHLFLDCAEQSALDALETALKRAEATGDLIYNKIADKITQKSQELHQRIMQEQLEMKHNLWSLIKNYQKRNT